MVKHPDIEPSNYKEVYDYYRTSRTNDRINDAVFAVSNALYAPDVHYQPDALEAIKTQIALGKGAILAINHPSAHDPFVMAGSFVDLIEEVPELADITGFAKDSLLRWPARILFENTGCVPVFRQKSYPELDSRTFTAATNELMILSADLLTHGKHISLMPEGTRSDHKHLEQLEYSAIKTGIARIALLAGDAHSFVIPVGIRYRNKEPGSLLVPRGTAVVFGDPITNYTPTTSSVRRQVTDSMNSSLADAVRIAKAPLAR